MSLEWKLNCCIAAPTAEGLRRVPNVNVNIHTLQGSPGSLVPFGVLSLFPGIPVQIWIERVFVFFLDALFNLKPLQL